MAFKIALASLIALTSAACLADVWEWERDRLNLSADTPIELGEKFFQEIIEHPIPLDLNTLKALKRSPLGLDLYLGSPTGCSR